MSSDVSSDAENDYKRQQTVAISSDVSDNQQ